MAIRLVEQDDGGFSPMIFCDGCGARIRDYTDGLIAWPLPRNGETEVTSFAYLHRKDCDTGYRASQKEPTMWLGLHDFFNELDHPA